MNEKERGFTLIEVLVALVIMAMISGLAYKGVSIMISARSVVSASTEKTRNMQVAFAQWNQDWTGAASMRMRPGALFSGNAVRMIRPSKEFGQVVAWKSTESGLERLAWSPAASPDVLKRQWDDTWLWVQASSSERKFESSGTASVARWPMLRDMSLYYYMENTWTDPYRTDTYDGWPDGVRLTLQAPNGPVTLDWKNVNTTSVGRP